MTETTPSPLGNVITIDDDRIKHLPGLVVRGAVEETLNALLDAEADGSAMRSGTNAPQLGAIRARSTRPLRRDHLMLMS
jgi:hypothetical protein